MKKIIFTALLIFISQFIEAKQHFIINMVSVSQTNELNVLEYDKELQNLVAKYNGKLQVSPIHVSMQINTEIKPATTVDFEYDVIYIFQFNSKKEAKQFASDKELLAGKEYFTKHTIFLSKKMSALPGMPDFPLIKDSLLNSEPSFILINAIKMKKDPSSIVRMMKYFKRVSPLLDEYGTQYFATFKVKKVVKGNFNFEMLFLTEWDSMEKFRLVHDHKTFKENVHLRNKSFKGFTEAKGAL